jgi:hypothetical protein
MFWCKKWWRIADPQQKDDIFHVIIEEKRRKSNTITDTRVYKSFKLTGVDRRTDYPFGNF